MKIKSGNGQLNIGSLQKGLVGHWTMSQDSLKGSLLADKTPHSNDGIIYGATFTTDRKGKANSAMSFDGVDDYTNLGNFDLTGGQRSISVWINSKNMPSSLSDRRFFSANYFEIKFTNGNLESWVYDTSFKVLSCPASELNSDTWYHIVITISSNNLRMYINGILMDENNTFILTSHPYNLNIGANYSGRDRFFNGSIDDVRIYNRVLSQEEIIKLYESYNPCLKLYGGDKEIKSEEYIRVDKNVNNAIYFEDPESNLYGKTYFYVMKYQARNNGGVPQSTGTGLPWTSISQLDAIQKSKDAGYHLITNWEWMAIARDIEQVADNWTGGAVGSGMIKRGNVGITDDGSYDGANPETGILNDKAKLKLSNGEEIYHFSGNVWEWVDRVIPTQAGIPGTNESYVEIKSIGWATSTNPYISYDEVGPLDSTLTGENNGIGKICKVDTTSARAFRRGGTWSIGAAAGVFALNLDRAPSNPTSAHIGFRCARYGNE